MQYNTKYDTDPFIIGGENLKYGIKNLKMTIESMPQSIAQFFKAGELINIGSATIFGNGDIKFAKI